MKQKLISELQPGDSVLSFFVVRKKEVREKKTNRALYLTFEFGDRSGRIRGTIWDHIQEVNQAIQVSDIVKIKGKVITFHEGSHISIEKVRKTTSKDNVELRQFLPSTDKNIEKMYSSIMMLIDSFTNSHIQKLLYLFFKNEKFKQQFSYAPAAKLWHHNYLGGLLEHTLSVAQLCDVLQQHYPQVNRDILLAGALLHDIGKIAELSTQGFINYSTKGRLIGHITMSAQIVTDKIKQVKGFPDNLKNRLLHNILSHHGQKEYGSPVVPMTLEAFVLNYADELDSKMAAFQRIMKKEKEPGKVWSNYINLLDRFIYLGEE